jgi:hypothetical protein
MAVDLIGKEARHCAGGLGWEAAPFDFDFDDLL